jgi:hypothetical protein
MEYSKNTGRYVVGPLKISSQFNYLGKKLKNQNYAHEGNNYKFGGSLDTTDLSKTVLPFY